MVSYITNTPSRLLTSLHTHITMHTRRLITNCTVMSYYVSALYRHFSLQLNTTDDSREISLRHTRYCLVLRRSQAISSFNYSPLVMSAQHEAPSPEVKTWYTTVSFQSTCCSALEQSATECLLFMLLQSHRSRHITTTTGIQDMSIKGFAYPAHQHQTHLLIPSSKRRDHKTSTNHTFLAT